MEELVFVRVSALIGHRASFCVSRYVWFKNINPCCFCCVLYFVRILFRPNGVEHPELRGTVRTLLVRTSTSTSLILARINVPPGGATPSAAMHYPSAELLAFSTSQSHASMPRRLY
eukprot:scaffold264481_cov36-Prasinocladus_malaysianus.AAC.1